MARSTWALLVLIGSAVLVGCTVPNPRLCKNDPGCVLPAEDLGVVDLGASPPADGAVADGSGGPGDAAPVLCSDDRGCADGGGRFCDRPSGACRPCDRDDHCGPSCASCTGTGAPYCSARATTCVVCRMDGHCSPGNYCNDEACRLCNQNDHCGTACRVCTGSAHPVCDPNSLKCSCINATDCGSGASDKCMNGACQRTCLLNTDCTDAVPGHVCISFGLTDRRCGCNAIGDCPAGTTTCTANVCLCGGAVCKAGQTCTAGACK